jgi:hypothetical protein
VDRGNLRGKRVKSREKTVQPQCFWNGGFSGGGNPGGG